VPVPDQIIVLLALNDGILDNIPVDRIRDAEAALRKGAATFPPDLVKRLMAEDKLDKADRETILQVARNAIDSSGLNQHTEKS